MSCKCVAYQIAQDEYSDAGKCVLIKTDFECPLCHNKSKSYNTHIGGDYQNSVFECTSCHEYVKYYIDALPDYFPDSPPPSQPITECWKEEFYIFNDNRTNVVMFDYSDSECTIGNYKSSQITIPIFKFSSREQLVNKTKLYITFS